MRKMYAVITAGLLAIGLAALPQLASAATAATDKTAAPAAAGIAHVRVLQAMPDGPSLNVALDDKTVDDSLAPNTLSPYFDVPSGKCHFVFTGSENQEKLWNSSRTVDPDAYYTAVLYADEGKPALELENESNRSITEGKARIYFYNFSPDAGDVRITVASKRAKAGYVQWLKRVRQNGVSSKSASTGSFTLQLRHGDEILKEIPDFNVAAGQRSAVFILGKSADLKIAAVDIGASSAVAEAPAEAKQDEDK